MSAGKGEAPGRLQAAEDSKEIVLLAPNTLEYSQNHEFRQVELLRRRYGLSGPAARIIAQHAFGRSL